MKTLIIIRGASSTGKTTLAKALTHYWESKNRLVRHVEADMFMLGEDGRYSFDPEKLKYCHDKCFYRCKESMIDNWDVIIQSNTNIKKWEMEKYKEAAREYGYNIQEIVLGVEKTNANPDFICVKSLKTVNSQ